MRTSLAPCCVLRADVVEGDNKCAEAGLCCDDGYSADVGWDPVTGLGTCCAAPFASRAEEGTLLVVRGDGVVPGLVCSCAALRVVRRHVAKPRSWLCRYLPCRGCPLNADVCVCV